MSGEARRAKTDRILASVDIAFIPIRDFDGGAFGYPLPIMWYVYIIRSIRFPDQEYTGASEHLKQRIVEHNAGRSTHTAKFKPWKLVWYCAFSDKYKALEFERYLKSHSGRAFAKKRLL